MIETLNKIMVTMGFLSLLIGALLSPDTLLAASQGDQSEIILEKGKPKLILPFSLEQLLRTKFGYEKKRLSARNLTGNWAQFIGTTILPYAVLGDFSGNTRTEVAMLYAPSDFETLKGYFWRVFVCHQDKEGNYIRFDLDKFRYGYDNLLPHQHHHIKDYRLMLHKANKPIRAGNLTLPYTYSFDSIALVRIDKDKEEIERIYAWDSKIGGYRRTILDDLGKEAIRQPPEPDLPRVVGSGIERTVTLPKALQALLARDFPNLRLPGPTERGKGRWVNFTRHDAVPWATWGDYNGDGLKDITLMLLDKKGGAEHWRATVFMQTDNHSYEVFSHVGWFNISHGRGKVFPPHPPQWYYLVTAPKGSKIHYKPYRKNESDVYQHDAVLLTNLPERPIEKIMEAEINIWNPKKRHFEDYSIGDSGEYVDDSDSLPPVYFE